MSTIEHRFDASDVTYRRKPRSEILRQAFKSSSALDDGESIGSRDTEELIGTMDIDVPDGTSKNWDDLADADYEDCDISEIQEPINDVSDDDNSVSAS